MFEKAHVETVFFKDQNKKSIRDQFSNWNKDEHDKIVQTFYSSIEDTYKSKEYKTNDLKKITEKTIDRFFNKIPDNTLIVSLINTSNKEFKEFTLAYPFFSSHIMLPIKPGEVVWVYKYGDEKNEKEGKTAIDKKAPFIDKCYWLSRVHGESFSEDLNYTHHDRGFMPIILENPEGSIRIPDFNDKKYSNKNSTKASLNNSKIFLQNHINNYKNIFIESVVKNKKNPGDLLLQGSNNNSIKLYSKSDNHGNISLTAGKIKIAKSTPEIVTSNFSEEAEISMFTLNGTNQIKNHIDINISDNNDDNDKELSENFKNPNFYEENLLSDYKYSENTLEGELDASNDASFIRICEKSNKLDYINLYNIQNKNSQGKVGEDHDNPISGSISEKTYTINNFKNEKYPEDNSELPSIIAKSNNIVFVARKDTSEFDSGKICLIKDSDDYSEYGHIIIDQDGHIGIDGQKIVIGTLERNKNLKNGEGSLIHLGQSPEMEPLVKGLHLKATLEHLIVNIQNAFDLIGEGMQSLSEHTHPSNFGTTAPPVNITANLQTIHTEINSTSKIQKEMEQISQNLNNLLSKLVRTS